MAHDWRSISDEEIREMTRDQLAALEKQLNEWLPMARAQVNLAEDQLTLVRKMRNEKIVA